VLPIAKNPPGRTIRLFTFLCLVPTVGDQGGRFARIGFGNAIDDQVRFDLIVNEHRTRQAGSGLREMF
jgi:hypothetical protein